MPITTHLENAELLKVTNQAIVDLIVEANDKTNEFWVVREEIFFAGWFGLERKFSLMKKLWATEYQVIAFSESKNSRLRTYVSADLIIAYLTGYLAGLEK